VTGKLSLGTLSLKAIYNVSEAENQVAFVNILTHLINTRVIKLVKENRLSVAEAITQAQQEFVLALQEVFPVEDPERFSALNVYNNDDSDLEGNAYLGFAEKHLSF